jgi:hypothetical protein
MFQPGMIAGGDRFSRKEVLCEYRKSLYRRLGIPSRATLVAAVLVSPACENNDSI